jgi:hypothetical protein
MEYVLIVTGIAPGTLAVLARIGGERQDGVPVAASRRVVRCAESSTEQCRGFRRRQPAPQRRKARLMESTMSREVARRSDAAPATSLLALAVGAAAFGVLAIGALAIGRLAVGRLTIKKARFNALEVDELTVRKLRILEEVSSDEAA